MVELIVLVAVVLLISLVLWQRARRAKLQRRVHELQLHPERGDGPAVGQDRLNTQLDDPRIAHDVGFNARRGGLF